MADPLTAIGAAASILQLVQIISKGLVTLRNAVIATKDVYDKISAVLNQVEQLSHPISLIQQYVESRPADIEHKLRIVISNVTTSCVASLETIRSKLPEPSKFGRSRHKLHAAIKVWRHDQELEQASRQVDGYLQNLTLILAVLNMCVLCATKTLTCCKY